MFHIFRWRRNFSQNVPTVDDRRSHSRRLNLIHPRASIERLFQFRTFRVLSNASRRIRRQRAKVGRSIELLFLLLSFVLRVLFDRSFDGDRTSIKKNNLIELIKH